MTKSLLQIIIIVALGAACIWVMKQWENATTCKQCNLPRQNTPTGQPVPDHYFREPANKFNIAAYF